MFYDTKRTWATSLRIHLRSRWQVDVLVVYHSHPACLGPRRTISAIIIDKASDEVATRHKRSGGDGSGDDDE